MKYRYLWIVAFAAGFTAAPTQGQENPVFFGVKAGQIDADQGGFDTASNIGFLFGYALSRDATGVLALESEYTRNLSDGDIAGAGDWRIETLAVYGAYRTTDDVYLKAKAGALSQDVKCQGTRRGICAKASGVSFGAGVGWRLNRKVGFELEYTLIEEDIGFLSLGYFTHF